MTYLRFFIVCELVFFPFSSDVYREQKEQTKNNDWTCLCLGRTCEESRNATQSTRTLPPSLSTSARVFGFFDFVRLSWLLSECDRKQRASLEKKNKGSITRLRQHRYGSRVNDFGTIVNLAGVELTTLKKEVLCIGVDFGIPPRKSSEPEILAEFEILQRQATKFRPFSKEKVERSRCELAATARELAATKPDVKEFSLEREHLKVLSELRTNRNLVITRPDKGRATVIMTKTGYVEKMMKILGDKRKFLTLGPVSQIDQTAKLEQHLRSYLNKLKEKKEVNDDVFERIAPTAPKCRVCMACRKFTSPTHRYVRSCQCVGHHSMMHQNGCVRSWRPCLTIRSIKDSFTFVDKIRKIGVPRDWYMCSFDVVNLFTSVPLAEVIDICADALYRNDDIEPVTTTLSEDSFRELMRLATSGVEFSFNETMFRQIDGVAMGSPLGPALANIFVGFKERKIPANEWPQMYHRYVDDVFSLFESKARCADFHQRLNNLHPALRFTLEEEDNGSLPFVDVRVTKKDTGFVTSLYRKPTFSGLYTPWDSFSPTQYKINLVRCLTNRILRICSQSVVQEELATLRKILERNGHPGHVLDKWVTQDSPQRRVGLRPCPLTLRVPWLGRKTERLIKGANDAVRLAYPAGEVRAVYSTNRAFRLPKEGLPTHKQSNLIYSFECRQCESRYVGQTQQPFGERIKQHVPRHIFDSARESTEKRRGRPPKKRQKTRGLSVSCCLPSGSKQGVLPDLWRLRF